jgi:hypothetical protein
MRISDTSADGRVRLFINLLMSEIATAWIFSDCGCRKRPPDIEGRCCEMYLMSIVGQPIKGSPPVSVLGLGLTTIFFTKYYTGPRT